jgi:hypothetical protein
MGLELKGAEAILGGRGNMVFVFPILFATVKQHTVKRLLRACPAPPVQMRQMHWLALFAMRTANGWSLATKGFREKGGWYDATDGTNT